MTRRLNPRTLFGLHQYFEEQYYEKEHWIPSSLRRDPIPLLCYYCLLSFFSGNGLLAVDSMRLLTLRNGFLSWVPKSTAIFCFQCSISLAMGCNCLGFLFASLCIKKIHINLLGFVGFSCHSMGWLLLSLYRDYYSLLIAFGCMAFGNAFVYVCLQAIGNMFAPDRVELEILALLSLADVLGTIIPKTLAVFVQLYPLKSNNILFFWSLFLFFLGIFSLFALPFSMPFPRKRSIFSTSSNNITRCVIKPIHTRFSDHYYACINYETGFRSIYSIPSGEHISAKYTRSIANRLVRHDLQKSYIPRASEKEYTKNYSPISDELNLINFRVDTSMYSELDLKHSRSASWETFCPKESQYMKYSYRKNNNLKTWLKKQQTLKRRHHYPINQKHSSNLELFQKRDSINKNYARHPIRNKSYEDFYQLYINNLSTSCSRWPLTFSGKLARILLLYSEERKVLSDQSFESGKFKNISPHFTSRINLAEKQHIEKGIPEKRLKRNIKQRGLLSRLENAVAHEADYTDESTEETVIPYLSQEISENSFYYSSNDEKSINFSNKSISDEISLLKSIISNKRLTETEELVSGLPQILVIFLLLCWLQFANAESLIMMRPLNYNISYSVRVTDFYLHMFELVFSSIPQTIFFFLFVGLMAHIYINWRALISVLNIMNFFVLLCFGAHLTRIVWVQLLTFISIFVFHFLLRGYGLLICLYLYGRYYGLKIALYSFVCRGMGCFLWTLWHGFCFSANISSVVTRVCIMMVLTILMFLPLILLYLLEPAAPTNFPGMTTFRHTRNSSTSDGSVELTCLDRAAQRMSISRSGVSIILLLIPILPPHMLIQLRCFRKSNASYGQDNFGRALAFPI